VRSEVHTLRGDGVVVDASGCISAGPRNPIAGVDFAITGARNSHESMMTDDGTILPCRLAGDDGESDVSSGFRSEQRFRQVLRFPNFLGMEREMFEQYNSSLNFWNSRREHVDRMHVRSRMKWLGECTFAIQWAFLVCAGGRAVSGCAQAASGWPVKPRALPQTPQELRSTTATSDEVALHHNTE